MKDVIRKNLFAIAFIADFASPNAVRIMNDSFGRSKVVIYSLRGKAENGATSRCKNVIERTISAPDLADWAKVFTPVPEAPLPLAEAINKIEFDLNFRLHPCSEVIIATDAKDSCGENTCRALEHLQATVKRQHRKLRIQVVGPGIECKLPKTSSILVQHVSTPNLRTIAARSQVEFDIRNAGPNSDGKSKKNQNAKAATIEKPSTSVQPVNLVRPKSTPSDETITVQFDGPPISLQFVRKESAKLSVETAITARLPHAFRLEKGLYLVSVVAPSWMTGGSDLELDVSESLGKKPTDVKEFLGDHVKWIPPSGEDQVLMLADAYGRDHLILIPKNSPEVPVPGTGVWHISKSLDEAIPQH